MEYGCVLNYLVNNYISGVLEGRLLVKTELMEPIMDFLPFSTLCFCCVYSAVKLGWTIDKDDTKKKFIKSKI